MNHSVAFDGRFVSKMCAATVLALSLLAVGWRVAVSAQGVPPAEICNGKDDDGDGQVDEGVHCDHYLTYLLDKSITPISVVLRDQFITPTDFTLTLIERLFNPARKLHAGLIFNPRRPDLHYLAYRVQSQTQFSPRTVFIQNQVEQRPIVVTKPRYLLTPTGKRKLGIPIDHLPTNAVEKVIRALVPSVPQNANHYLCWDIEPYNIATGVSLTDQFQKKQFDVIRARYLCNPVEKNHNGKVSKIVDEQNHLVCYDVIPHNSVNRHVLTHDQFAVRSLKTIRTEEVCVPTVKTLLQTSCIRPDTQGTAVMFDAQTHLSSTGGHLVIVQPTVAGGGLTADVLLMSNPDTVIQRTGSPAAGETYTFDTEMLQLSLSNGRVLTVPMSGQIMTDPRTPGDPVQSFDTDMHQLQGQLPPGDPDFDLLRVTAGGGFGLPSPGHTTMTQQPGGTWAVDSFFDITYRIDFVGAPGGPLAGQRDSTTGTLRVVGPCPLPEGTSQ